MNPDRKASLIRRVGYCQGEAAHWARMASYNRDWPAVREDAEAIYYQRKARNSALLARHFMLELGIITDLNDFIDLDWNS